MTDDPYDFIDEDLPVEGDKSLVEWQEEISKQVELQSRTKEEKGWETSRARIPDADQAKVREIQDKLYQMYHGSNKGIRMLHEARRMTEEALADIGLKGTLIAEPWGHSLIAGCKIKLVWGNHIGLDEKGDIILDPRLVADYVEWHFVIHLIDYESIPLKQDRGEEAITERERRASYGDDYWGRDGAIKHHC